MSSKKKPDSKTIKEIRKDLQAIMKETQDRIDEYEKLGGEEHHYLDGKLAALELVINRIEELDLS